MPHTVLRLSKPDVTRFVRRLALVLFGHGMKRRQEQQGRAHHDQSDQH